MVHGNFGSGFWAVRFNFFRMEDLGQAALGSSAHQEPAMACLCNCAGFCAESLGEEQVEEQT